MAATTIFQQKALRIKGENHLFLVLALISLVMTAIGFSVGIQRPYIMIAPAIGMVTLWRNSAGRTEDIIFLVNKDGPEFYFTYKDEDKQRLEDVRIDEYRYWYYIRSREGSQQMYHLFFVIETDGNMYCLKEKISLSTPPLGWEYKNEDIGDQKDILLVPELRDLASFIDRNSEVVVREH